MVTLDVDTIYSLKECLPISYKELWKFAEQAIKNGKKVTIQHETVDASPIVVIVIKNLKELSNIKLMFDNNQINVDELLGIDPNSF